MSATDPFPRAEFGGLVRHLPAYARLAWRLAREPLLSRARRIAVVAAAGYLASPIDAVPGVIPVAGQLDDVAVAIAAIRFALAGLDAERRRAHLAAVGLEDGDLAADLRTTGTITAWLVRAGARGGLRGGRLGVRTAARLARAARGPAGAAVRRLSGRRGPRPRSGE
ncbi:MAG TPA: YkvA family protein [Candidatus Limnocylindrales bacterium]|nr:YkvA family protein [Candidatus Limnocylindrales bacterium]